MAISLNKGHDIATCFPVREGFGVVSSTSHTAAGKVPIPDRFSQQNFRTAIVVQ
jgi:hypothetical protein